MKTAVKTKSGYDCIIDEEAMDDIRLFDLIKAHDSGSRMDQIAVISDILVLLMGEEQKKELYDHLIKKEGRPKISTLEKDIGGLISDLSTPKKK